MRDRTIWRYHTKLHRPRFYRYKVADHGHSVALGRNVYRGTAETRGSAWIGLFAVVGRYAYCVTWANARLRQEQVAEGRGR